MIITKCWCGCGMDVDLRAAVDAGVCGLRRGPARHAGGEGVSQGPAGRGEHLGQTHRQDADGHVRRRPV